MILKLKDYVPLYQATGCANHPRLVQTDVAIRGQVELFSSAKSMDVAISGGIVSDQLAVEVLFNGYPRYLLVEQLGVELPDTLREKVM